MEPKNIRRRPSITHFSRIMEKVLRNNDHKQGWSDLRFDILLTRIRQETDELLYAHFRNKLDTFEEKPLTEKQVVEFVAECADIANFAMMLSENMIRRFSQKDTLERYDFDFFF